MTTLYPKKISRVMISRVNTEKVQLAIIFCEKKITKHDIFNEKIISFNEETKNTLFVLQLQEK